MAAERFVRRSRALALLTAINCLGVRAGSRVQAMLTLTAIAAIALLEGAAFAWRPIADCVAPASTPRLDEPRARVRLGDDADTFRLRRLADVELSRR